MSSHTPERLAMMANQIVRNLAHEDDPAGAAASHIHQFWTPAMITMLRSEGADLLDPAAQSAMDKLARQSA